MEMKEIKNANEKSKLKNKKCFEQNKLNDKIC